MHQEKHVPKNPNTLKHCFKLNEFWENKLEEIVLWISSENENLK